MPYCQRCVLPQWTCKTIVSNGVAERIMTTIIMFTVITINMKKRKTASHLMQNSRSRIHKMLSEEQMAYKHLFCCQQQGSKALAALWAWGIQPWPCTVGVLAMLILHANDTCKAEHVWQHLDSLYSKWWTKTAETCSKPKRLLSNIWTASAANDG